MIFTAATCLALTVYHEARSEPYDAQLAVAEVVMNRVAHPDFPDTVCGVMKEHRTPASKPWACQFSFYCDGKSDQPHDAVAWSVAQEVSTQALSGDVLGHGAIYYHTHEVSPAWRHNLIKVGGIGGHVFYTDGECLLSMGCSKRPQARPEGFTND